MDGKASETGASDFIFTNGTPWLSSTGRSRTSTTTSPAGNSGPIPGCSGSPSPRTESVRRLYEDGFEFDATGKHLYAANEVPEVNVPDDDETFWRRWLLVEFPNHYRPSE